MTERLEYLESKIKAHRELGESSMLSILEVAKLYDSVAIVKQKIESDNQVIVSARRAA